ncbi:MAG: hypothetical protein OEZ22_06065 [Spirochaetia bacterium]|nr:hypothetical protein [Spirochaetia bacterium]
MYNILKYKLFILINIYLILSYLNIYAEQSTYLEHYQRSNFLSCSQKLSEITEKRNLDEVETLIYGECLFQIKEYKLSAFYFAKLLKQEKSRAIRAASRLLDIYSLGETEIPLEEFINYILANDDALTLSTRLQPLLLSKNQIQLFLVLYKKNPIIFNEQQLSVVAANSDEKTFAEIININTNYKKDSKLLWAKYYITHKKDEKALILLDELISETQNYKALLLKASILWNQNKKDVAVNTLMTLEKFGQIGYDLIASFYFENGDMKKAIKAIKDAISKGYPLHDKEIFYEMSAQNFIKAAYLLEKYYLEANLSIYRYQSLYNDYFRQGNKKDYWNGLKLLEKENQELCERAINEQLAWDKIENILPEIRECVALNLPERYDAIIFSADSLNRHDLIISLLENKNKLNINQTYLLAKSFYLYDIKSTDKAMFLMKAAVLNSNFIYATEAEYFLGKIYLRLKKYREAENIFKTLNYQDSSELYFTALMYQDKWDSIQNELETDFAESLKKEKIFYQTAWSLKTKQGKQSENLLEIYLQSPAKNGSKAVYLLFLLKYFKHSDNIWSLCLNLLKYPEGLKEKDWLFLKDIIKEEPSSELEAFSLYWYSHYLYFNGETDKSLKILRNIENNEFAKLLKNEIKFILIKRTNEEKNKNIVTDYFIEFPDTPFRVFVKP